MKRFLISLIILFIISLIFCYNSVLATTEIQLSANSQNSTIPSGSEIEINISINKLAGLDKGVNAYVFSLRFDTNDFEFAKIEGQNNWNSPTYNETKAKAGTVKFATTRTNFTTQTGTIAKLTLKAKRKIDLNNKPNIEIYNISFAGKTNNMTQKVIADNITVSFDINQKNDDEGNLNNRNEENGGTILNNKDNDISNKRLPYAGEKTRTYILIPGLLALSSYCIYKYKKYRSYEK